MKFIPVLFLSFFIGCTVWSRGPVDPITPPWPLRTLPVDKLEFPGHWVGIISNTIWVIEIAPYVDETGRSGIKIKSNTDNIHYAAGWLLEQKGVFVGQALENGKSFNIMIFRDEQGTKLRIADTRGYFDLKLLKSE